MQSPQTEQLCPTPELDLELPARTLIPIVLEDIALLIKLAPY